MLRVVRWYLNNRLRNYNYLLVNDKTNTAIAIDPLDSQLYLSYLNQHQLHLEAILLTHSHGDHHAGVPELVDTFHAPVYAGFESSRFGTDYDLVDGEQLHFNTAEVMVIATAGHIADHFSFYTQGNLFCGDTIFNAGVGNIHDPSADILALYQSIERLKALPSDTLIYPSHDYVLSNLDFGLSLLPNDPELCQSKVQLSAFTSDSQPIMTLADELKHNLFMRCDTAAVKQVIGLAISASASESFKRLRALKDDF